MTSGWHTTSAPLAREILAGGLRVNPPSTAYGYEEWVREHRALYGRVHPAYVALKEPFLMPCLARHHGVDREDLVVLEVDLTGLELHIDLPMLHDKLLDERCYMEYKGRRLRVPDRSERGRWLLDHLRRATGSTARRYWFDASDFDLPGAREAIIDYTGTATVCRDIAPERIARRTSWRTAA
jgi:hypothetical protein